MSPPVETEISEEIVLFQFPEKETFELESGQEYSILVQKTS
jgi:hypothetical protein